MDIALGIISIAAFVISVGTLVERVVKSRLKIECSEVFYSVNPKSLWFRMVVVNKSTLPVSVTRVQILDGEKFLDANFKEEILLETSRKTGGTVTDRDMIKSTVLPVNLMSLQASNINVNFDGLSQAHKDIGKPLTLQISTSRGVKTVSLNLQHDIRHAYFP